MPREIVVITLDGPFELNGETIAEVEVREVLYGDHRRWKQMCKKHKDEGTDERSGRLISLLTILTPEHLDELTLKDFDKLSEAVLGFFPDSRKEPDTSLLT